MSETWDVIAHEILYGSLMTVLNLLKVIVPLMIVIELLMVYKLVDKLATKMGWFARLLGVGKEAVLPLLVGVIMGVTYGAGTLVEINKKTPLSNKDFLLIGVFMFACHGIIETTFLFGAAGASVIFVSVIRLLIAIIVTMTAARLPQFKRMQ